MNEHIRNEIIVRSQRGQSQREIATVLHLSRNTVKAVIDMRAAAREGNGCTVMSPPVKKRASVLDDYETEIRDLLVRCPKMKVVEIYRRLQAIVATNRRPGPVQGSIIRGSH